ncbi:MAG TPA: DUF5655 domain-containing protein [Acidobacteriota bacterium]|nr:DUF5655 domain-containing protein [Acidobacteriota bacterium]
MTEKRKRFNYSLHPGFEMQAKMTANMKEKTGRTLEEWADLIKEAGFKNSKEAALRVKEDHGVGTNFAKLIGTTAFGELEEYDPDALVEAQYEGPKAKLRPVYDRLLELGFSLGEDVKACPAKTIVPLYRNHVFAQIRPTTQTRIDLGLALGDTKATGRLIDTGGLQKGDRITHRIPVVSMEEIDEEVIEWLKKAYALDAGKKKSGCC